MTVSNEEAERIYNDMRYDFNIDINAFDSEESLRDFLNSLISNHDKLSRLGPDARRKIVEKFLDDWRFEKGMAKREEERKIKELAESIKSIARLQEMIDRGEIDIETAEKVRPILEEIEAGEPIEIPKEVTGVEIVGRAPETKRVEVGEVPTISLPKEEKKPPEYPPQTFTERERQLIEEINRKVAERTSPQRITGTVQRTVFGVRDAVVNVGNKVVDTVKNVIDWIKKRLGGD